MDSKRFNDFIQEVDPKVQTLGDSSILEFTNSIRDLKETYEYFKAGGTTLISEGDILKIGVVGQVKAGKSSFLNSLFFEGESVLPKASTPMTAGLTILEYSDKNEFEVEYYTEPEWEEFKKQAETYKAIEQEVRENKDNQRAPESFIIKEIKSRTSDIMQSAYELVSRCGRMAKSKIGKGMEVVAFSSINDLQRILNQYVGAEGEYTSVVKMLTLRINDSRLKGIRIVDTPGVNDPIVSRENRTKEFLHSCHGVFFLSYSSRFFDSVDVNFMNSRIGNQGVGTVLMLASKYDDVLQDQGNRFHDDLEGADNASRDSLEKRFNVQKSELLHPNIDIRFDTTSGISYALASKSPATWDEIERHVDKRMHDLFPAAFATKEEANDTYMLLANFDQIKDEYLEKMFKGNKDKIIQSKISEYFQKNIAELAEQVSGLTASAEQKLKQLDTVELKDVYRQQKEQDELFTNLKGEFTSFLNVFQSTLQTARDSIYESLKHPHVYSLPMDDVTVQVTFKGDWWGHNTEEFYIKGLDSQALKEQLLVMVEEYCEGWKTAWKDHFTNARQKMFDSFCEAITEFSKNVTDLNFSDKYYRQIMTQLLSEIEMHGILKLQDIQTQYSSEFASYCDNQSHKLSDQRYYDCKRGGVQGKLNQAAMDVVAPIEGTLNAKMNSFIKNVSDSVDGSVKPIIVSLNNLKKDVDSRLKSAGKEYLDDLKRQIENKEATKREVKNLLDNVKPINEIIDSLK